MSNNNHTRQPSNSSALYGKTLVNCPHCKDDKVYPVAWEWTKPGYACNPRCPNCESRWTQGPLSEDALDAFDAVLDAGTDQICALADRLAKGELDPAEFMGAISA